MICHRQRKFLGPSGFLLLFFGNFSPAVVVLELFGLADMHLSMKARYYTVDDP